MSNSLRVGSCSSNAWEIGEIMYCGVIISLPCLNKLWSSDFRAIDWDQGFTSLFKLLGAMSMQLSKKKKAGDFCPTAVHDFEGDHTYSEKPETASYDELDASSYDALFIPAGQSLEYLALDETVLAL
ncbi:hypothetical protein GH714_014298 [Hevea brasiliensis]|uniref:DJ-1/PfpI domain-containing protein n=1 Tax=Hevea brasiliensis TaxID=3981 RepID=A0A6A6KR50_HEVBR|nr:hypothetical protein GH714_014298 [Hevea brasiliensis]